MAGFGRFIRSSFTRGARRGRGSSLYTVRIHGLREFQRALKEADEDTRNGLREQLAAAGEIVAEEARSRFAFYSPVSAAGYQPLVRMKGVAVRQTLRKTTGLRPDFGALQMRRALEPALDAKQQEVVKSIEDMLERMADEFNHPWL
jgi:hypothetical protein